MIEELLQLKNLWFLAQGLGVTILISAASLALSFVFGTFLGVLRHSDSPAASKAAGLYVEVVRNIPNLLFILGVRFLTPLPPLAAAIVAFTIFTTAAVAEIVRGGLNSIPKGQWEAARSQGFSALGILVHVVLPQALRNMVPPLVSQAITVIKDTSFVWVVGIEELTGKGMILMGMYATLPQVFALFTLLAATYFALNFGLSRWARTVKVRV